MSKQWHSGPCKSASGKPGSDGYGKKKIGGKTYRAHRVAYCEAAGISLDSINGLVVMHTCDNPICVNPKHLQLGTPRENIDDMLAKGRSLTGEKQHKAKLTELAVREIRASYVRRSRTASARALAEKFGVGRRTICAIVLGERWGCVK